MAPSVSKLSAVALVVLAAVLISALQTEAKLLGRQRFYEDSYADGPYGGATGERAIITVRGTRNPYNGYAPGKIAIEDEPFRGPYPRGVYDRLDGGYGGGRGGLRPMPYGGGYGGPLSSAFGGYGGGSGYNNGGYGGYGSGR